mgnify:FL=1
MLRTTVYEDNTYVMTNINQHTSMRPEIKTIATFVAIGIVAVLFGVALGWGASKVLSSFKPASFYVLSSAASAVESFSLLFTSEERLTVAPTTAAVDAGDMVTLTLNHLNKGQGEYSFHYPCVSDLKFSHAQNIQMNELACGEKTSLGAADLTDVTLLPMLGGSGSIDVPVVFYFTGSNRAGAPPLFAQALISVTGDGSDITLDGTKDTAAAKPAANAKPSVAPVQLPPASQTPPKKNPAPSATVTTTNLPPKTGAKTEKTFVYYSTGPTASDPQGVIDLLPRILEVGFVDKNTTVFTASSSPSADLRIAVKFEVINDGTKASGSWSFSAVLPTMPLYIYSSDTQQPLLPGEKIEFVIGFDSVERKKDGEFIVNVDPTSRVVESNELNNIIKTLIQPAY